MRRASLGLVPFIVIVCVDGCSQGDAGLETVPVSGQVLYRGKPVSGAKVIFTSGDDVPSAFGVTGDDGRFELTTKKPGDGAIPGTCSVTVSKDMQVGAAPPLNESMEDALKRTEREKGKTREKFVSPIPERYANPATSGLQFTVEKGKTNDFEIKLRD